jgi:hypothetical protein
MDFNNLSDKEKLLIFTRIREDIPLPLPAIEKDWWVVQTLAIVFQMEAAPYLFFKGGTSLSKAWGIIERFSEDVDLVLSREFLGFPGNISRTQVGKLRDASYKYISESILPELRRAFLNKGFDRVEVELTDVTTPDQDPVNISIRYPSLTEGADYVLREVKLEIGSRSMLEPYTSKSFCSFVGEIFKGQSFADIPISVPCVNPERTFLEKLFLLHEEFQRTEGEVRVDRMSRHLYDIQKISKTHYAQLAFENKGLYDSLVWHREHFMRWGGIDYNTHFPPTLSPVPPDHILKAFESDYKTMQEQMIYGDTLPFDQLISEIKSIALSINNLKF